MRGTAARRVAAAATAAAALVLLLVPLSARAEDVDRPPSRLLVDAVRSGITRDTATDTVLAVFGLPPEVADEALLAATRARALPTGYEPRDLVGAAAVGLPSNGTQYLRRLVVADTRALFEAAAEVGYSLQITSGYRSFGFQRQVFEAQVARRGDAEAANRWSARPGYSQHQLGTTIDFADAVAVFRGFGTGPAGRWLWDNAHEYGFVFPYTDLNQERTGYVPEPWHARWVGRDLARWLYAAGYQGWSDLTADDVVAAVREAADLAP